MRSPLGHPVERHSCDVFFLTTAHEDVLIQAPSSRGPCHKIKSAAVLGYKYSVERSDQMLSHYYTVFQRHMLSWQEKLSTHFSSVQRRTRQTGKAVKTYCNVLPKMLCRTLHWAVFWVELHKNELLEVKVTIEFQRQCGKNLISAQCVNCSGHLVTTNFEITASKFPIVVSSTKCT
jgi:hypothetical protein